MADEKRQIILDLLARDKSGQATDSFARNLDKLGRTAEDTKRQVGTLDKEIVKHQENLKGLAKAYAETDDKATRLDLSKAMRSSEAEIKKLSKSKSILEAMLPSEAEAAQVGKSLGQRIYNGLDSMLGDTGPMVPALAGMAVAAAPFLAATISGAIIGAAGVGGVVGGALLAKNDPRVKAAFADLGTTMQTTLQGKAVKSFAGPLVAAAGELRASFKAMSPDLDRILSSSAKFVGPLTAGVSEMMSKIVHGLADMIAKAGPVIDSIKVGLSGIGGALGQMFTDLSGQGVAAATALDMAFGLVIGTIKGLDTVLVGLTETFGFLVKIGAFGRDAAIQYAAIEAAAKNATAATQGTADATAVMSDASKASARVIHGEVNALSDLASALKAQTDPAFGFLDAQDKMKKAQQAATKALEEHGRKSPQYRDAVRKEAQAALMLEDAAGKVAATSDGKMTPALRSTLKAAGMTAPEIAEVGRQMEAAHRKGDAFAKTYKANVKLSGIDVGIAEANAIHSSLRAIAGTYTATIRIRQVGASVGSAAVAIGKKLQGRAVGGPVAKATPYVVGEAGPELFMPSVNGTIMTAEQTARLVRSGTRPGAMLGGGGGRLVVDVRGADSDMIRLIRKWINNGELSFG